MVQIIEVPLESGDAGVASLQLLDMGTCAVGAACTKAAHSHESKIRVMLKAEVLVIKNQSTSERPWKWGLKDWGPIAKGSITSSLLRRIRVAPLDV